jgi:hypothetical protein
MPICQNKTHFFCRKFIQRVSQKNVKPHQKDSFDMQNTQHKANQQQNETK